MNTLMENCRRVFNHGFTSPEVGIKYHGLMNQGATCYLNSVLQVLFMTKDFREAVERHSSENPDAECFELHLTNLFEDLKRKKPVYTFNITQKLGIKNVFEQHDAAEYFEKILSLMSSKASQIFHGELTHKNKCSTCGTKTNTDGPFWHLPLALVDSSSENYSVVDGIEKFFTTLKVSGENQMYCEKCDDKADATLKSLMTHHPDVLMLQLKRFEFDYRYMTYVKINHFVNVPFTLQIPENHMYELYAVVDHFGGLRSGHYTATIKSDDDDIWYNFNDARVSMLPFQPFQVDNTERSQSAYLLFYKKKKVDTADTCNQDTTEMSTSEGLPMDISAGADDQAKKRKELSVETYRDENVEDESNDSGGLDDITQRGLRNMSSKRNQKQRGEEEKGLTGEKVQERDEQREGASHKQQHFSQDVEDQNNVGFDDRQSTLVGVEKQAEEQGNKGDNEHMQHREDSSLRQAGSARRGRLTQNHEVGDKMTLSVNSQPKAKSDRQTKKYKVIFFEEYETDSGIERRVIDRYIIETVITTKLRAVL